MSVYPNLEAIRNSCPAIGDLDPEEVIPVKKDEFDATVGIAACSVPTDLIIEACTFGCRNVTAVSSTGCPLRDEPRKVSLQPLATA